MAADLVAASCCPHAAGVVDVAELEGVFGRRYRLFEYVGPAHPEAAINAAFDDPAVRYLTIQADHHAHFRVADYAPWVRSALALLERAYTSLGLTQQASEARSLREANSQALEVAQARELERKSKPGFFERLGNWFSFGDSEDNDGNTGQLPDALPPGGA